jgi:hypothetical protein
MGISDIRLVQDGQSCQGCTMSTRDIQVTLDNRERTGTTVSRAMLQVVTIGN